MAKKTSKVMKYEIIKPVDIDWNVFESVLRELQFETKNLMNKTIQLCWEWQGFSSDYKKENGEYPKLENHTKYKAITGFVYDRMKTQYNKFNTGNMSISIKSATDKWKSDLKDILRGEKSIPSYKKNVPIDIHGNSIKIKEVNKGGAILQLSLISSTHKKEIGFKNGFFNVLIKIGDNSQHEIVKRLFEGDYKISASKIVKHKYKNKWFLNLTYSFVPEKRELNPDNIMGIDVGVVNALYMAFNESLSSYSIEGGEITKFRKGVEARRKSLLRQGKYCGEGRKGRGRATRIKPIKKLSQRIDNFKDSCNHKYSKYVIDMALKHNCGTIQMEDLTGIAEGEKKSSFLGNWTYFDLQEKITYKAKEHGIKVVKIKPKYTSQRCSKCGFISKDSRPDQATFECIKCNFKTSADYNAARNIAMKDIEKIIAEQLKVQEKAKKLTKKQLANILDD